MFLSLWYGIWHDGSFEDGKDYRRACFLPAPDEKSQTLHVGKSNATRGKVKCYTWESQTLHVGKSDASR